MPQVLERPPKLGKMMDSYLVVCPLQDGTVTIRKVFYDSVLPTEDGIEIEIELTSDSNIMKFLEDVEEEFGITGEWTHV